MARLAHVAKFGTVSSGTMRPEDLIPEFADTLDYLLGDEATADDKNLFVRVNALTFDESDDQDDEVDAVLESLFDRLNELAPDYGYFGARTKATGADYGFWLSSDFEQFFEGLKVDDLGDVPKDYSGEVLVVNDHGNVSLYDVQGEDHCTEIWSIV